MKFNFAYFAPQVINFRALFYITDISILMELATATLMNSSNIAVKSVTNFEILAMISGTEEIFNFQDENIPEEIEFANEGDF